MNSAVSTDWSARVAFACHRYGALGVSRAATAAMRGDGDALARLGLDLPATGRMFAAERAQALAYRLMDDAEQALDTAEASIDLARLPRGGPTAPDAD